MMLKVNGEYLDFNGSIEIEKKIKLFEDIETTDGDVSFAFELELTSHNIKILRIPFPDSRSKRVYNVQDTEVLNDEGLRINKGSIRIESISGRIASCSFFGGNSNWFAAISGNLTDLDLSRYDKELTEDEIMDSWLDTEGIIYPIIDTGTLITRRLNVLFVEDFVGCMFIHTLMKEIFKASDIKIQGELIDDPFYKSLVVVSNTRSKDQVNNRTCFIGKLTTQTIPQTPTPTDLLVFTSESLPYFDGSLGLFDLANSRYIADTGMTISIKLNGTYQISGLLTGFFYIYVRVNGSVVETLEIDLYTVDPASFNVQVNLKINAGDYVDFTIDTDAILIPPYTQEITFAELRIDPIFIYDSFGSSSVPFWTRQQFVSNIFRIFNCISSYDSISKTLTINYFDKIKEKTSIDVSEYTQVDTIDYTEFIGNYGKQNTFSYQDGSDEELAEYNISEFIKYGSGVIEADNDFIEQSANVVESDFTAPISYRNTAFVSSFERINFVEYDEVDSLDITSVTDSLGVARFNISNANDLFTAGDVVRIETDVAAYNGETLVNLVGSTYIETFIDYQSSASGTATKLNHKLTTDDSVYIMSVTKRMNSSEFSGLSSYVIGSTGVFRGVVAFFNLLRLGNSFENSYKQGLSFGGINSPLQYQKTLLDSYWRQFDNIVNDPVMCKAIGHMPWKVYNSLDFLSPVIIKTLETSNQYYINRITGYQNSYTPCEVELIKLP